ncbi:MAG: hypothetical protein OEL57_04150 [Trichlorobacter sp.]|uniref:hypothetical protein n=1 Tax=Trichlorobacter sp. TaxID=2911007 RepID=UPI0025670BF6|nr:hypothetical protein [Trichlorobacter sp.]MDK9717085.1 hypothetical protein [Trichlorobacter sp.]
MSNKARDKHPLRHIISFRVSDQELKVLKALGGKRAAKLSSILRQLVKQVCNGERCNGKQLITMQQTCNG